MHRNIAGPNVSSWDSGYRDFNNEQEMSKEIVHQINKHIKEDDVLFHLGDWSFAGVDKIWEFRKQIKCRNIHLILGNHDHHIEHNKILPNCHYERNWTLHDGKPINNDPEVKSRGLFSSVQHVKSVTIGKNKFFLSHFAHRVWDKSHHGVIHLYGHSHASIDDNWGKSMDVGVDNAYKIFGEYRPFYLQEILDIMNNREIKILDHHNSKTT